VTALTTDDVLDSEALGFGVHLGVELFSWCRDS
jgi:hypothetical protein